MIMIGGVDRRIVDEVSRTLAATGRVVTPLSPEEVASGDAFVRLHGQAADVVHIDALPRLAEEAAGGGSLEALIRLVASAGARLVLVTARAADDPELAALRRSGASYIVLRAGRLIDLEDEAAARLLVARRIVVPAELASRAAGGLLVSDLCAAVLAAVGSDDAGRTLQVAAADGPDALRAYLERIGARPTRSRFGAAIARLAGRPRLALGQGGALAVA